MGGGIMGVLLFNLGITILLYSWFPVLFAAFRRNPIETKTYNVICYVVNIVLALLIKALITSNSANELGTVSYSFVPCLIWTALATGIGKRILNKNAAKYGSFPLSERFVCGICGSISAKPLNECPKCGVKQAYIDRYIKSAVPVERRFMCKKCGAQFSERRDTCPRCGAARIIERPTIPYICDSEPGTEAAGSIIPIKTEVASDGGTQKSLPTRTAPETNSTAAETDSGKTDAAPMVRFCRECGQRLDPDMLFCPNCSTKVIRYPVPDREKESSEIVRVSDGPDVSIREMIDGLPRIQRRAFILTEDGEWDKADKYFERVLDDDPENAFAYLGKLLCENHINEIEKIGSISDLTNNKLFKRALQYSDETLRKTLRTLSEQKE